MYVTKTNYSHHIIHPFVRTIQSLANFLPTLSFISLLKWKRSDYLLGEFCAKHKSEASLWKIVAEQITVNQNSIEREFLWGSDYIFNFQFAEMPDNISFVVILVPLFFSQNNPNFKANQSVKPYRTAKIAFPPLPLSHKTSREIYSGLKYFFPLIGDSSC